MATLLLELSWTCVLSRSLLYHLGFLVPAVPAMLALAAFCYLLALVAVRSRPAGRARTR